MRMILVVMLSFLIVSCGKEAPPVTLELLDGNVLQQQDWTGKWVYINYWAEWCKPCAEEIPELNAFAAANPQVLVFGVNFDKASTNDVLRQSNALRIAFPVVVGDIRVAFPHDLPQSLPATLVYNPKGELVDTLQGAQTQATLAQVMKM